MELKTEAFTEFDQALLKVSYSCTKVLAANVTVEMPNTVCSEISTTQECGAGNLKLQLIETWGWQAEGRHLEFTLSTAAETA